MAWMVATVVEPSQGSRSYSPATTSTLSAEETAATAVMVIRVCSLLIIFQSSNSSSRSACCGCALRCIAVIIGHGMHVRPTLAECAFFHLILEYTRIGEKTDRVHLFLGVALFFVSCFACGVPLTACSRIQQRGRELLRFIWFLWTQLTPTSSVSLSTPLGLQHEKTSR